jgi:hypothetical protein
MLEPSRALYIKLGRRGICEETCIRREQDAPTRLSRGVARALRKGEETGDWSEVRDVLGQVRDGNVNTAKHDTAQVRRFYEADARVLWITPSVSSVPLTGQAVRFR